MESFLKLFGSQSSELYSHMEDGGEFFLIFARLADVIREFIKEHSTDGEFYSPRPWILVSRRALIAESAQLSPPCVILEGAQIRHCALLRGSCFIGRDSVVGNSCEIKNSILFDGACAPHFNYVGDSILGARAHLGAGVILSNLKSDGSDVTVRIGGSIISSGRRKLGALIGDDAEIGCGAVLNPGTVIGANATVYPLLSVRGYVPDNSILKSTAPLVICDKEERL